MQLPWAYLDVDDAAEQYLRAAVGRVDEWLAVRTHHYTTPAYLMLLRPLAGVGVADVWAVDTEELDEPDGRASIIRRMVVRFPDTPDLRRRAVDAVRRVQKLFDVTHDADVGERYAILGTALLHYPDLL